MFKFTYNRYDFITSSLFYLIFENINYCILYYMSAVGSVGGDVTVNATLFQDVILPCPHGIQIDSVEIAQWVRLGDLWAVSVALHDGTTKSFSPFNMTYDFNLYISNAGVHTEGAYKCIITPSEGEEFIENVQLKLSGTFSIEDSIHVLALYGRTMKKICMY